MTRSPAQNAVLAFNVITLEHAEGIAAATIPVHRTLSTDASHQGERLV